MADRVVLPGAFGGHPGPVFALAYAPNGLLASGGWDGTVRLWDAAGGTSVDVLRGHDGSVRALAFSADGRLLVSAGRDRTVRLWDVTGRREPTILWGQDPVALSVAISPRGDLVASAHRDGTVRIWTRVDWSAPRVLGQPGRVVAFSPDNDDLAVGDDSGAIRIFPRQGSDSRELIAASSGHLGSIRALAYSPDGQRLAAGDVDGVVRIWEARQGKLVATTGGVEILSVAFSPDGNALAVGLASGNLYVCDHLAEAKPKLAAFPSRHTGPVYAVAFSPDGGELASAGDDGAVVLQPLTRDAAPTELVGHVSEILSVAYSPGGECLATGDVDGVVRIWETRHGKLFASVGGAREWVRSLAFSDDGAYLVAAIGREVHVWDATTPEFANCYTLDLDDDVTGLALCSDESGHAQLDCATRAGRWQGWHLNTGLALPGLIAPALSQIEAASVVAVRQLAASRDGDILVCTGAGSRVRIWSVAPGVQTLGTPIELRGEVVGVNAVAVSRNGAFVASGGDDVMVRLWDRRSGTLLRVLNGHTAAVRGVAFAPDGVTLVSVGDDGRITQWNTRSGKLVRDSGQTVRPMPQVPGLHSDEPSPVDLLGVADDVRTLATLVAAAGTRPPLAIALLGEWGAGKSSVMLQMQETIDRLATLSRANPGQSLFADNVRQVRFNAWHYNDDNIWTGLIEQLFRTLATDRGEDDGVADPETVERTRDRLKRELDAQQAYRARLDRLRPVAILRARWRDLRALLFGALFAATAYCAGWAWRRLGAVSGVPTSLLQRAWAWGRALGQPSGALDAARREAGRRIEALEDRLARVDTATRLAVLLRESTADSYASRRGLIGQVQHDLDNLSKVLTKLRSRHDDWLDSETLAGGEVFEPPLERIVLYIDDLDRCAPARVVELLAAVHLMLTLPLFVVVVAVDPRWLRDSLREHYSSLLTSGADAETDAAAAPTAGPLDYLGKIFQIPFALRRLDDAAVGAYLATLLGDGPDGSRRADHTGEPAPPSARIGNAVPSEGARSPEPPTSAGTAAARAAASSVPTTGPAPRRAQDAADERPRPAVSVLDAVPDLRPGGLILRPVETAFMRGLGPLLPTPRAAKKLVNLYRLVRIGIPEEQLADFVQSGMYQPVQILLGVLVGDPVVASAVFTAIRDAASDADIVEVVSGAHIACTDLAGLLAKIRQASSEAAHALDLSAFKTWCPQLARYSFHPLAAG